ELAGVEVLLEVLLELLAPRLHLAAPGFHLLLEDLGIEAGPEALAIKAGHDRHTGHGRDARDTRHHRHALHARTEQPAHQALGHALEILQVDIEIDIDVAIVHAQLHAWMGTIDDR